MRVSSSKRGSHLESTPEGSEYSDGDLKLENLQSGHKLDLRRRSSANENYRQEGLLRRLRDAQGFIEEVVAEKELLIELLQTERALHYWRLSVFLVRGNRHFKVRVETNSCRRFIAKAFASWAMVVSRQQHLKFSISNLILSRENSMSKSTLLAWAYHVRNVEQNNLYLESMLRRKDSSCRKAAFEQWCQHSRIAKRQSSQLSRREVQHRRDKLASMLCAWYSSCVVERKHNKLLQLTRERSERRQTKSLFGFWVETVRRKRKLKMSLSQLLFRTNSKAVQGSMFAWYDQMCANRKLRRSAETIISRVRSMLLNRALFGWVQICRRKLGLYGKLQSRESRSSKSVLARWMAAWTRHVAQQSKTAAMLANRATARHVAQLAEAVARWRWLGHQGKRLQHAAHLVETRRALSVSGQCLQAWYWLLQTEMEAVDAEKAAERKVEGRRRAQAQVVLAQTVRRWQQEARHGAWRAEEAEKMRARGEEGLLRGLVGEWQLEWSRQGRGALEQRLEQLQLAALAARFALRRAAALFADWKALLAHHKHMAWAAAVVASWASGREVEVLGACWDGWARARRWAARSRRLVEWMGQREALAKKAAVAGQWQVAVYEELKSAAIVERSRFLHNLTLLMKPFLVLWFGVNEGHEERRRAHNFRYKVVCGAAFKGWYELFWWRRQAQVVAGRFARRAEHWADRRVRTMLGQWASLVELIKLLRRGQARACLLLWTNTKREYWTRWARRVELVREARRRGREAICGRALRAWHDSLGAERGQRILDLIAEASFSISGPDAPHPMPMEEAEDEEEGENGLLEEGDWEGGQDPSERLRAMLGEFGKLPDDPPLHSLDGTNTDGPASSDRSGSMSLSSFDERRP